MSSSPNIIITESVWEKEQAALEKEQKRLRNVVHNYREELKDKDHIKFELFANKICSMVGQQLEKHYPGWLWHVACVDGSNQVTVKNMNIHGEYGFAISLRDLMHDPELALPVLAGGEILERCGFPRGRMPMDVNEMKRDIKGNIVDLDIDGV